MKIILHIGQSKTGTSAIQGFLTRKRKELQRHGVLYPVARVGGFEVEMGSHNTVADALAGKVEFPGLSADDYFTQFFNEARRLDADVMILSGEHFIGGQPRLWDLADHQKYQEIYSEKIINLASYLAGHDVSIVVYLRPQVDWLSSTIAQNIKISRLASERPIYESDRQFFEMFKPCLRYCELMDLWNDIVKPQSITAVPYVRSNLVSNNSVSDFLFRTNLSHIKFSSSDVVRSVNVSLSREYVEVKKLINKKARTKDSERIVIECLKRLSSQSRLGTTYKLSADVVRDLEGFVAADNARLSAKYMVDAAPFIARVGYRGEELPDLSEGEISRAMMRFEREYGRFSTWLLLGQNVFKSFLRRRAPSVHAGLHHIKRYLGRLRTA